MTLEHEMQYRSERQNVATCTALTAYEPSTNSDPCLTLSDWGALACVKLDLKKISFNLKL